MNTIFPRLSVLALAVSAAAALAAADGPAEQRIEVTAARAGDLEAAQVVLSKGDDATYEMSTGRRMKVSPVAGGLRVRYSGQLPAIVYHDGSGRFVSRNGQLSLVFELDRDGDANSVRLSMPTSWL